MGFTTSKARWRLRWVLSALALIVAIIVLSVPFPHSGSWWVKISLSHAPLFVPLPSRYQAAAVVITASAATIVFGWVTFREELKRIVEGEAGTRWVRWLLVYLVAVAALFNLMKGDVAIATLPRISEAAVLLVVASAAWCLAAMPARFWLNCLNRDPKAFSAGITVGLLAYAVGRHYSLVLFGLIQSLQHSTLWLASIALRPFASNIVFDQTRELLGTSKFVVQVTSACSGLEGITLFLTFFSIYLWVYRKEFRFPAILILLPLGAIALYILNIARLVALILIGSWSSFLAVAGFHSVAGWFLFNAATLSLVIVSRRSKFFAKSGGVVPETENPGSPYLVPLLVIIATAMITRVFFFKFDLLYPLRAFLGAAAIWFYLKRLPLRWRRSWSSLALGVAAFAIWVMLVNPNDARQRDEMISAVLGNMPMAGASLWILARVAGAIVVAPIAEELAFRGYLIRKLVSTDFETVAFGQFTWISLIVSSVLFGMLHSEWLAGTIAGIIFALAAHRRGMFSDAVVSHATANGLLAAYVVMTGHWSLWE